MDLTEELPLDDENVLATEPPSMWRRYRWPIVGLVVVLIGGAVGLTLWLTSSSTPATGLTVTTVTVKATTGTIQQTVASSGTLEPASQAALNFAVSGTVTGVNVKAGQTVTAGQVLATVDTTALSDEVTAAAGPTHGGRGPPRQRRVVERRDQHHRFGRSIGHIGRVLAVHGADQPQRRLVDLDDLRHGGLGRSDDRRAGDRDRVGLRRYRQRQQRRVERCQQRGLRRQRLGFVVRPDRGDRDGLLHRQRDGRRHRNRRDRRRRSGRHHPERRYHARLRHGRIDQPHRQRELRRDHLPRGDRRDGQPDRPLRRRHG